MWVTDDPRDQVAQDGDFPSGKVPCDTAPTAPGAGACPAFWCAAWFHLIISPSSKEMLKLQLMSVAPCHTVLFACVAFLVFQNPSDLPVTSNSEVRK